MIGLLFLSTESPATILLDVAPVPPKLRAHKQVAKSFEYFAKKLSAVVVNLLGRC